MKTNYYLNRKTTGLLCIIFLSIICACTSQKEQKPNVVLIMTDDQGYGDIAANGHPTLKTPNLDKLISNGVLFTDFHVSPFCAPTRASLMTGRDARRTGIWHTFGGRNWMHEQETTIAEIFKGNGYSTGHFGKWHLGDNYPFAPHYRGFDISLMLGNSGMGAADDYWDNDRFNDTYFLNGEPVRTNGFGTDVFTDAAIEFIKKNKEKPFFVYLATNIPHRPWNIPSEYRMRYETSDTDTSQVVPYNNSDMARFYGSIDKIDEQVGRVMDILQQQNLDKNTIVLFLTDNGTVSLEYNAGMRGKKGSPYEGGHRVPLIINWGDGKFGKSIKINELTAHTDIAPTLIDLCGLQTSKELQFDGQSLLPLLKRNKKWNSQRTYITQSSQRVSGGYHIKAPKYGQTAVCKEKWRLVNDELYDIKSDPEQKKDIAEQYPEKVNELKNAYERYWENIEPFTEKTARVHIGNPQQLVTTLSLSGVTPCQGCTAEWSMAGAINARKINGTWPVFVEQAGQYKIELRRWPKETGKAINAYKDMGGRVPGKEFQKDAVSINPEKARIKIADTDITMEINPSLESVTFTCHLKQGPQDLQTWFIDKDGTERCAYWAYISKI